MDYQPCVEARERDLIIEPETAIWTTECLLPRGICPNTNSSLEAIREHYQYWSTATDPEVQSWRRNRLDMLLSRLPTEAPTSVIDYGTYFGEVAARLVERWPCATITAMDIDQNYLTVVEEQGLPLKLAVTRPGHIDADAESVEMIVMGDVAEHVYEDEWYSILADAFRVLREGGRLFTHSPIADVFIGRTIQHVVREQMLQVNHPSIKSIGYIEDSLRRFGFESIHAEICHENNAYGFASARRPHA